MYSKEELKVLNKLAKKVYGLKFTALDSDDQDAIYCMSEEKGLL